MLTHIEIISAWPGDKRGCYAKLAEDINQSEGTIAVWKHRGRIPPDSWAAIVSAARKRRIRGVTLEVLVAKQAG